MPMKSLFIASAILLSGFAGLTAQATPITYTVSATASGSLGLSNFTNALVTLTLTGDTTGVFATTSSLDGNIGSATADISGLGTATLTDTIQVFVNRGGPGAGIQDAVSFFDILDTLNTGFGSYDLRTAIGPLSGDALFNSGAMFPTNLGDFSLSAVGDSTFTATFGSAPTTAVPEPASMLLLGTSLVGLMVRARWRRRQN